MDGYLALIWPQSLTSEAAGWCANSFPQAREVMTATGAGARRRQHPILGHLQFRRRGIEQLNRGRDPPRTPCQAGAAAVRCDYLNPVRRRYPLQIPAFMTGLPTTPTR